MVCLICIWLVRTLTEEFAAGTVNNGSTFKTEADPAKRKHTTKTHREVSLRREPLREVVEGIRLGADRVAVPMDLIEQVG